MQICDILATILDFGSHTGFIFETVMSQINALSTIAFIHSYLFAFNYFSYNDMPDNANLWHFGNYFGFWQPYWFYIWNSNVTN